MKKRLFQMMTYHKNNMKLKKLLTKEAFPILESFQIGDRVKVVSPELADYNKIGEVVDQAPSGKFYMVKLKSGNAYFHESDLKIVK